MHWNTGSFQNSSRRRPSSASVSRRWSGTTSCDSRGSKRHDRALREGLGEPRVAGATPSVLVAHLDRFHALRFRGDVLPRLLLAMISSRVRLRGGAVGT